jgi:hypothetical protein
MNRLGILIDITHASGAAQTQIIQASEAPVVASHLYASSVSGPGALTDDLIEAVAAKGGLRPNGRRRIPAARRPRADQRAISRASNRGACHGEAAW